MTLSFDGPTTIFTNHNYSDWRPWWVAGNKLELGSSLKRLLLLIGIIAATSTATLVQGADIQWTEFDPPGSNSGKQPMGPPIAGAPSFRSDCTPQGDGAWYRFCMCGGGGQCTISYYSLAPYFCPTPAPGQTIYLTSAVGHSDQPCSKKALEKTISGWGGLGIKYEPHDYTTGPDDPPGGGGDPPIGGLEPPKDGKKPDDKTAVKKDDTKKTGENSDSGKTDQAPKTDSAPKSAKSDDTKTPGTGTGQVEKRPRKEVKHKTTKHRRAKINNDQPSSSGGVSPETANAISNIIDIAAGAGLSRSHGHTGGYDKRGDRPTKSVTPKRDN
jgi:hypothetical protein